MQTVEYYIKRELENANHCVKRKPDNVNVYYLSGFDFKNTSDVEWTCNFKYAFSFPKYRAAWALKTYIEETCGNCDKLSVVEVTTIIEDM